LEHLDTFQDGWFIQIQPVPLKGERSDTQGSVNVVEKIILVDSHSFCFALVKTEYAESGACLKVGVFVFNVEGVNGIVVVCPGSMEMFPYSRDGACGPSASVAFVCPSFSSLEMGILQT
jgi:hypothetical protein